MKKSLACWVVVPLGLYAACTADNPSTLDDEGGNSGGTNAGAAGPGPTTTGNAGGGLSVTAATGSTGSGVNCNNDPDVDDDGDGFTENQGDCNDCDPNVNPDAIEVIGDPMNGGGGMGGYMPADENCNNEVDEPPVTCDQSLGLNDTNPLSGAKAIDICQQVGNGQGWGVVSASYTRANGTPLPNPGLTVGLAPAFGANAFPQNGSTMLVLSSGYARPAGHPESCGALYPNDSCSEHGAGTPPPGFPQGVPSCPGASDINDDVALELSMRAPTNATGYQFDFAFMSFEFPEYVCTSYNDQFIALVSPPPMGSINGNISFDSNSNPVSVNIALFDHCDPAFQSSFAIYSSSPPPVPNPYCPAGPAFMNGTGFNEWDPDSGSGSTGWLVTTAPVGGGENFTIRFAIWDTGDTALDSTVLIDNFRWTAEPGTSVGTEPVPDPR